MQDSVVVEAYLRVSAAVGCSVDGILTNPECRERFLREARQFAAGASERDLLQRLINLRKRSRLPRVDEVTVPNQVA